MSAFPTKFIHENQFVGVSEITESDKEGCSSLEDQTAESSASSGSSMFNYTLAEQVSAGLADRQVIAALSRQSWLQRESSVRPAHCSVGATAPMLTRLRSSIGGVDTLLIGGALVAGLTYIFVFDSSTREIDPSPALMTTLSEMHSDIIPLRSRQSSPPWLRSRGIDKPDGTKAIRVSDYDQGSFMQALPPSHNRPSESDARAVQAALVAERHTRRSKTIRVAAPQVEVYSPDASTMLPAESLSAAAKPSIEPSSNPPQRPADVPEPAGRIVLVESSSQIAVDLAHQAVPLPRPSPKLKPKAMTAAPFQTPSRSPLVRDSNARVRSYAMPADKPELTAAAVSSQSSASTAASTTAPSADRRNPVPPSDSADPPAAGNWWKKLLSQFQPGAE